MMKSRSSVMVNKGLVASSHELASFWGAKTLSDGGNVVDAAITTSAVLAVVQNNLCGIGGDLFTLMKVDGKEIRGLNGSGRAGERATVDFYRERNISEIPRRGPESAITVPGIVDSWRELSAYATMELADLLKPAIHYAENGFPITDKYSDSIRITNNYLGQYKGWKSLFVPNGTAPEAGFVLKQKDLASSLKEIAQDGPESFYRGHLMERITKGLADEGSVLTENDFRKHSSTWDKPLKTNYRGVDVYETYPNSQGATVPLWLNMLENFNMDGIKHNSPELLDLYLDTGMKAYAERNSHITDPAYHDLPADFSSKKYAEKVLNSGFSADASAEYSGMDGDTTYFSVADSEGNAMSVIQSNYMGFGSGVVPTGTGFSMQNRGSYFSLDEKHHNSLVPGKRTFHTLCASIGEEDGETRFVLGTMGGDIQPQIHLQLISSILDYNLDVQAAIDNPRWAFPGTIYENPSKLQMEPDLVEMLGDYRYRALNNEILGTYSSATGHAQAIYLDGNRSLWGAADPRGDGAAAGF